MKRLEYKVVSVYQSDPNLEDYLNRIGAEGWHLSVLQNNVAIFWRELDETLGAGERSYYDDIFA